MLFNGIDITSLNTIMYAVRNSKNKLFYKRYVLSAERDKISSSQEGY